MLMKMTSKNRKIVVIGTSAGGKSALIQLLRQLPADFPAPILIVQHVSPEGLANTLPESLNEHTKIKCVIASDGQSIKPGFAYIAPADHHLMVDETKLQLTKGAQENRARPAIDPLFRSAAIAYGNRTIAILLTGYLDDGTSGMIAVQRCGGQTIVQDPHDAAYPDMPLNALNQMHPDYCVPVAEMGAVLSVLLTKSMGKQTPIPNDIKTEAMIAYRVISDLTAVNDIGEQVPFNCPGCGGVLWQIKSNSLRYRCHTGHAYTAMSLLAEQNQKVEETMWAALRMFEERRNLLTTMANEQNGPTSKMMRERVARSQVHIDRIRAILSGDDQTVSGQLGLDADN
jgi:two-component system chemotaxis response regulator CheB